MFKKLIKKFCAAFGLEVTRKRKYAFDEITPKIIQKKECVIFDIGANRGQSISKFKKYFDEPLIHAFEPHPEEFARLSKLFENDKKIILQQQAVGSKPGKLLFNINANSAHSSFNQLTAGTEWIRRRSEEMGLSDQKYTIERTEVEVTTVDEYCKRVGLERIDFLKVDTQGFEREVLEGAKVMLSKAAIEVVQVEMIFSNVYEKVNNITDIEAFLVPNGYKLFGASRSGNMLENYIFETDLIYVSNAVFEKFRQREY